MGKPDGSSLLWFHEDLDIYIHARNSFVRVITLSTGNVWKINIKYVIHTIASVKYRKILLIHNHNDAASITVLSLKQHICEKLSANIFTDTRHFFISEDGDYITFIDFRGTVLRINVDTLYCEHILELKDYAHSEEVNRFGFFHLTSPWYDKGDGIYVNYVCIEDTLRRGYTREQDFKEYKLNINNKKLEITPFKKQAYKMFSRPNYEVIFPKYHNSKFDLDIFVAIESSDISYNHIVCEFQRSGKYQFHFEVDADLLSDTHVEYYNENLVLVYCNPCGVYLCDLDKKSVKFLSIPDCDIRKMYLYKKMGYIILTYLDRPTNECYTIDDFQEMEVVQAPLSLPPRL